MISRQSKNKQRERIFLGEDDSTHMKTRLMSSEAFLQLATTSRHLCVHTWLIMHYNKGVIPPNVRQNLGFVFVLRLSKKPLNDIFEQYIQVSDYEEFDEFKIDFDKMVDHYQYPCMLIDKFHHKIDWDVADWWEC